MPIDRNKQWTEEECKATFYEIVNRHGMTEADIKWEVRDREGPGVFCVTHRTDTMQIVNKRVITASWMFSGQLHYKRELWLYRVVRPVDRLLHILHEAAHAVIFATTQNTWREVGHGLAFQRKERLLCVQHGYSPRYVRNPGYAADYVDVKTGETIVKLGIDWTRTKTKAWRQNNV